MFINFPMKNNTSKVEVALKKTLSKMSPSVLLIYVYFSFIRNNRNWRRKCAFWLFLIVSYKRGAFK